MSVTVGDVVWVRCEIGPPMECCIDTETGAQGVAIGAGGGVAWELDEHDAPIMESQQGSEWLPDHPALIPISRWLAEHGEEMLADLVSVGAHEIGDVWNAEQFGDAAYRETVKRAGLALIAALEEGTR